MCPSTCVQVEVKERNAIKRKVNNVLLVAVVQSYKHFCDTPNLIATIYRLVINTDDHQSLSRLLSPFYTEYHF